MTGILLGVSPSKELIEQYAIVMSSEPKIMSDPNSVKIGGSVAPELARTNEYAAPIKPGKKSAISRKIAGRSKSN